MYGYENIYNYRLKDAKKLALKINPDLKDNSYNIKSIIFYDTTLLNNQLEVFACTAKDQFGDKSILINQKYQKDDIEPLSCLISHELTHRLDIPTIEQEISATIKEVKTWQKLKRDDIKISELTNRLDQLLIKHSNNELEDFIKNSYKNIY